jgi:hypothetical protein
MERRLLVMMAAHAIGELAYSGPEGAVALSLERADDQPAIRASGPGIFLTRHPLVDETAADLSRPVRNGRVVGFLKVGPLLLPVSATGDGTLPSKSRKDGSIVGYGTLLF